MFLYIHKIKSKGVVLYHKNHIRKLQMLYQIFVGNAVHYLHIDDNSAPYLIKGKSRHCILIVLGNTPYDDVCQFPMQIKALYERHLSLTHFTGVIT